jgi:hypothetical protein
VFPRGNDQQEKFGVTSTFKLLHLEIGCQENYFLPPNSFANFSVKVSDGHFIADTLLSGPSDDPSFIAIEIDIELARYHRKQAVDLLPLLRFFVLEKEFGIVRDGQRERAPDGLSNPLISISCFVRRRRCKPLFCLSRSAIEPTSAGPTERMPPPIAGR